MASLCWSVLGLGLLLAAAGRSGSASSHSMRYFSMAVSDPNQGLPQYITVAYVDDELFVKYDSNSRKMLPRVPWIQKVVEYEAGYWERESQREQGNEAAFKVGLGTLRDRYKQQNSTGLHTWQWMYGCEVRPDGGFSRGYDQRAYNGEDFITLDLKTLTWTARVPQAQLTKSKWEDPEVQEAQRTKVYLEDLCVPWLQKYLDYGRESLLRTEAPTGKVARKAKDIDLETLICQVHGFYPKAIGVTWLKDGVDQVSETLTGGVVPNSDGTYHTWLSIDIDPKERDLYQCHVEHDGLPERLVLTWDEPASNLVLILGILGAILAVAIIASIIFVFLKKRGGKRGNDYRAAPGSDQGSDNSTKVVVPEA